MPITTTYITSTSYPIINTGTTVLASFVNNIVAGVEQIVGRSSQDGYQLASYFSLPVNSSTRVLARGYNTILTDLDLIWRHYTGMTVTNTATRLSAYHDAWVVNTGTVVSVNHWNHASEALALAQANRYNLHPAQLVQDNNTCIVVYDQSVIERTQVWGTGSNQAITLRLRAEWPTGQLANSFFNLGSEFVFSPFYSSMGLKVDNPVITGLVNYSFQTAVDEGVFMPVSVYPIGGGQGPVYHVNPLTHSYGSTSTYSAFPPYNRMTLWNYGAGVSGSAGYLSQNPEIVGTPYQFVGLHYGDYTTKLAIGVRTGQSSSVDPLTLRVTVDSGTAYYEVQVPGRFGRYTGPTNQSTLNGLGTAGWWIWEYDSSTETYVDRLYGWIDIYSGQNGADPVNLTGAVTDRAPHTLSLVPTGTGASSSGAATGSGSTNTNAWAQFIDEINTGTAQSYVYDRAKWLDNAYQTTVTQFTTLLNTFSFSVAARRNSPTPGLSRYIEFCVTATNAAVNDTLKYYDPYTYIATAQTCTNTANLNNSFSAARNEYTESAGGGDSDFPWWIVVGGGILAAVGVCFTGETMVWMEDGSKRPIRDVQPGDRVWNHDGSAINTVLFVEEKYREGVVVYSPNGTYEPFATDNHPLIINGAFHSPDPEYHWQLYPWLGPAHALPNARTAVLDGQIVYNLWLDGDHTYRVNDWATHSIIDDGAFLRLAVEQGHITKTQTIEILQSHTSGSRNLLVGSYYVNKWLGMADVVPLNRFVAHTLSGPNSLTKSLLRGVMKATGLMAAGYLSAKFKLLKLSKKI